MNIILLGAPGAGKGTQASLITEKFGLCHVSTGDILRKNIKEQTKLGLEAKSYMDKGSLVPDALVIDLIKDRISEDDCKKGVMFDGFPRTIAQSEALDKIINIDKVINISVDLSKLMQRLTGRRVCSVCGESFHVNYLNGNETCSKCGGKLIQRADDNETAVAVRLEAYEKQTEPLIAFYGKKGILETVDGYQDVEKVFQEIEKVLNK